MNNLFVIFWDTHFLIEIIKGHDRFFMINLYNKGPILTKYISIGTTSYLYSYDELIRYFHEVRNYESTFFFFFKLSLFIYLYVLGTPFNIRETISWAEQ